MGKNIREGKGICIDAKGNIHEGYYQNGLANGTGRTYYQYYSKIY